MTISNIHRGFSFFPGVFLAGVLAIVADAVSANDVGQRHLLPFIVDGDRIQSRLIVTNVSRSSSQCSLDLSGPALDSVRFQDHSLVTTEDDTANFVLEKDGGNLIWTSEGKQSLTFGYAELDCAEPATAQLLFSSSDADEFVSLASMFSARKADRFQFALMPQVGSLVLVVANDLDPDVSCEVELESPYGSILSQASISVPAMTSVFQMADELFRIPEDYTAGAIRVICDRDVAATGFLLHGGKFSVLPPVALSMPMISISSGAAVTEGGDAVFTISANATSVKDLTLTLMVSDIGNHVGSGDLGEKQVTLPAGMTSVDYVVETTDDSDNEVHGAVTATINPGVGYLVSETEDSAQVSISDNDVPALVIEPPATEQPVAQPPAPEPPDSQLPNPQPPTSPTEKVEPPSPVLTGVSFSARPARGRATLIGWETQPEDARLQNLGLSFNPSGVAKVFNVDTYYQFIQIHCNDGSRGDVEIQLWAGRGNVELTDTVNFFCE